MTEELEQEAQRLQQDKLVSLGRLAASVSHEINNPLAFVSSNLEVMGQYIERFLILLNAYRGFRKEMSDYASPEVIMPVKKIERDVDADFLLKDIDELVGETCDGVRRIRDIVDSLKRFARVDRGEWEPVDLNGEIEATLRIAAAQIKRKGRLKTELRDIPHVRCYPGQLSQVILNLVINATQAIEDRGEIRVETKCEGDGITVSVSDDGTGIPPDIQARLFEPFFTTKPADQGTGLGLAISKDIIEKHGGSISVESEPGQGSTFTIWLPVEERSQEEGAVTG